MQVPIIIFGIFVLIFEEEVKRFAVVRNAKDVLAKVRNIDIKNYL